ncbi:MAG TPA: hypothetical protein VL197_07895 [Nitrospirota bacterium]|nr:hypothetical protein [Nitrospirota bacterium]
MTLLKGYLAEVKKQRSRGRCLHYDSGNRCNKIISAHSIQESGQLRLIEEDGHVYRISSNISTLKKAGGRPQIAKIGVNKVSTFDGFCQRHDNELFRLIDNKLLVPNAVQISLYAYRCLCREYFVKENAVRTFNKFLNHEKMSQRLQKLISNFHEGSVASFARLQGIKTTFDKDVKNGNFDQFEYVCFISKAKWNFQLSGVLYPDYDFLGQKLQDLLDLPAPLSFITFFTAPVHNGWSFTFAWHKESSKICSQFMGSLAALIHNGGSIEDALLRFSFTCCENHAIRISWWDSLTVIQKSSILERFAYLIDLKIQVPNTYLATGLEGIADWHFDHVYSAMRDDKLREF